jgi:hypothetical protein
MSDDAPRRPGRGPARHARPASSAVLTPPAGLPATPDGPAIPAAPAIPDAPEIPESTAGMQAVVPPRAPARPPAVVDPCVCRHAREAHEHWRRGTDCGVCGPQGCSRYRRRGGAVRRFLRRLRLLR